MSINALDKVQAAYDAGYRNQGEVALIAGVARKTVSRFYLAGSIEFYEPFDEGWECLEPTLIQSEEDIRDFIDNLLSETLKQGSVNLDNIVEDKAIVHFIRKVYGDFKTAIIREGGEPYLLDITKTCLKCNLIRSLDYYGIKEGNKLGLSRVCNECLYESYLTSPNLKIWRHKRRAIKLNLPALHFTIVNSCVLTESAEVDLDHFIALATGHGGTYDGNIVPLDSFLNRKKNESHPFTWFETNRQRFNLVQSRFDVVISSLSEQNGLTPDEFRSYVDWCYDNKRSLDEILADNKRYGYVVTSVELWRDATGRALPLRIVTDNQPESLRIAS